MNKPTLVIMAAGMGSRFGGLKQISPVDDRGNAIIDFSLYDARRAGFEKVVFIIKHAIEADFRSTVGRRAEQHFDVRYVFQELDVLPEGFAVPEGRTKPWGTGHAVACCRGVVDGPFAVINADDFYGAGAYRAIFDFLKEERPGNEHAMVGYKLRNTVTENGYVSRGVCSAEGGFLKTVTERLHIEKRGADAAYTEDGREFPLSGDTLVSMNFWGFGAPFLDELWEHFPAFLEDCLRTAPLKGEYFLPSVANAQIAGGRGSIRLLDCDETWYGITYREDLDSVRAAIAGMKARNVYPDSLWDGPILKNC